MERDTVFDDMKFRSGGIWLFYNLIAEKISGIKEEVLLEASFDDVTPKNKKIISSWAYDKAITNNNIDIIDNRAIIFICYGQAYTFVEKLQTIATKFGKEGDGAKSRPSNFMRQYYDVSCPMRLKLQALLLCWPQLHRTPNLLWKEYRHWHPILPPEAIRFYWYNDFLSPHLNLIRFSYPL